MKSACVLVCLALPHMIVGSIFQKQNQYPRNLMVQPLDFIDQYQYVSSSSSNENSQEARNNVPSYLKKYVEVLKYDTQPKRNHSQFDAHMTNNKNNQQMYPQNKNLNKNHQQEYQNYNQRQNNQYTNQRQNEQYINQRQNDQYINQRQNEQYVQQQNEQYNSQRQNKQYNNQKINSQSNSQEQYNYLYQNSEETKQQKRNQYRTQDLSNEQSMKQEKRIHISKPYETELNRGLFNSKQSNEQYNNQNKRSQSNTRQQQSNEKVNSKQQSNEQYNSKQQSNEQYNSKQQSNEKYNSKQQSKEQYNSMQQSNEQINSKQQSNEQYNQQQRNGLNKINQKRHLSQYSSEENNQKLRYGLRDQNKYQRYNNQEQDLSNSQEQKLNIRKNMKQENSIETQTTNKHQDTNMMQQHKKQNMGKRKGQQLNSFESEEFNKNQQYGIRYAPLPQYISQEEQFNNEKTRPQAYKQQTGVTYGKSISWKGQRMASGINSAAVNIKDLEKVYNDAYKTIRPVDEEYKKMYHEQYQVSALENNDEIYLNATELMKKHDLNVEEHTVKTDDGYILTLFRIPPKEVTRDVQKKPVVFLMHGLLGSADDWLLLGSEKSLVYLLATAGYDVWLGNARGNKYSRRHVTKHPALPEFWEFSTDEIALHDLPAMIDYALKISEQKKLYYIGHSQGTTTFFALTSALPAYNDKIIMMYALSPMVYMSHVRSPLMKMIAPTSVFYEKLMQQLGQGEFRPSKEVLSSVGGDMLQKMIGCKNVSSHVNFVMSGVNMQELEPSLIPVIMGHLPAGTSTRQMKQYGQAVAAHEFRMYSYGMQMNQEVYGSSQPPKYNLKVVMTPVALYYSEKDWLAHPEDVARLRNELPVVSDYFKVPVEDFSSMDFQLGKSAPELVYKRIIESMQKNTTY